MALFGNTGVKVGDKVIVSGDAHYEGQSGVVKGIEGSFYAVELANPDIRCHNCGGFISNAKGRWFYKRELKVIPKNRDLIDNVKADTVSDILEYIENNFNEVADADFTMEVIKEHLAMCDKKIKEIEMEMKRPFKVGDIIIALPENDYGITNENSICEVEELLEGGEIYVRVISTEYESWLNECFEVDEDMFRKVK